MKGFCDCTILSLFLNKADPKRGGTQIIFYDIFRSRVEVKTLITALLCNKSNLIRLREGLEIKSLAKSNNLYFTASLVHSMWE